MTEERKYLPCSQLECRTEETPVGRRSSCCTTRTKICKTKAPGKKGIQGLWGWKWVLLFHLFLETLTVVPLMEALRGHFLLICISSSLVTNSQVQHMGTRMKGSQDTKPDGLNKDLLLASLFGGILGAGRIRTSVPVVRL